MKPLDRLELSEVSIGRVAIARNVVDALIAVARAARTVMAEREGPATICEDRLETALTALDSAIVKALGEGT